MSLNQSQTTELLNSVSKKFNISIDDLYETAKSVAGDKIKRPTMFSSPAAKKFAEDHKEIDISKITGTGKGGKVSIDDIRVFIGEQSKIKPVNLWGSSSAKELAEKHSLKESDFTEDEKTGAARKSGKKSILIKDIKTKLGLETPKKTTKKTTAKKTVKKPTKTEESSSDSSDSE